MPPTPVEIAIVEPGPVVDRFDGLGTIEAVEFITVVSEISATVVSLPFKEGKSVRRGDLLAQLDDAELRAEVARTEALRDQSKSAYDRIKHVVEQGASAPQDLDDAAAGLKVAEANVDLARARLSKTRILAPFDGLVGARRVSPGAFLQPGTAITDLAQVSELKAAFSAPERYLSKLLVGSEVSVSTAAFPGIELTGIISVIDPVVDPRTRNVQVIARVANPEERYRPGMSADIRVVLSRRENALTVPNESIFAQGNQTLVYVVNPDSTVSPTPVTLGTRLAHEAEVVHGLEPGAMVVKAGHQKLYPGARVMPVPAQGAGGPPGWGGQGDPGEETPPDSISIGGDN